MKNVNMVVVSGNLTRDFELRQTASGMHVGRGGIAVNDSRKNPHTGEWEDVPNFLDFTIFGNRAASLQPYLEKGTKVCIQGRLRWSSWESEGQKRSKVEIICEELELMSRREAQPDGGYQQDSGQYQYGQQQQYDQDAYEDIPF